MDKNILLKALRKNRILIILYCILDLIFFLSAREQLLMAIFFEALYLRTYISGYIDGYFDDSKT